MIGKSVARLSRWERVVVDAYGNQKITKPSVVCTPFQTPPPLPRPLSRKQEKHRHQSKKEDRFNTLRLGVDVLRFTTIWICPDFGELHVRSQT